MNFDISFKFVFASNNFMFRMELIPYFNFLKKMYNLKKLILDIVIKSIICVIFICYDEFLFI